MARVTVSLECGHIKEYASTQIGGQAKRGALWPCDQCKDKVVVVAVEIRR